MDRLDVEVNREVALIWQRKKLLFHQDNALALTVGDTTDKLEELHYEIVSHAPYSLDLTASNFFSLSRTQKEARWKAIWQYRIDIEM